MTVDAVLFDLDGTLTATNEIDSLCYVEAIRAEFGFTASSDWSRYRHCTDEGIAIEALTRRFGNPPSARLVDRLKRRFLDLLVDAATASARSFQPIGGAPDLLRHLLDSGWLVCIATGAWRASAFLKIATAGLPASIPVFASDGVPTREEILETAIASLRSSAGGELGRLVAVGDGIWDVTAAASLRLPFVGVASGERANALVEAGAQVVLPDYRDLSAAVDHLERSPPPSWSATRGVGSPLGAPP